MTDRNKMQLICQLQENVSRFFDAFHERHGSHMQCSLGCSKCCSEGLTVFSVEAQRIFRWFEGLEPSERQQLGLNLSASMRSNSKPRKCVFLHNNACSIYEARPVVCRTQGLPLQLKRADEGGEEVELSLCDLNFSDESHLPLQREWLDLERLNALLAIAQQQTDLSEFSAEVLNLSSAQSQRIRLEDLRDLLLRKIG